MRGAVPCRWFCNGLESSIVKSCAYTRLHDRFRPPEPERGARRVQPWLRLRQPATSIPIRLPPARSPPPDGGPEPRPPGKPRACRKPRICRLRTRVAAGSRSGDADVRWRREPHSGRARRLQSVREQARGDLRRRHRGGRDFVLVRPDPRATLPQQPGRRAVHPRPRALHVYPPGRNARIRGRVRLPRAPDRCKPDPLLRHRLRRDVDRDDRTAPDLPEPLDERPHRDRAADCPEEVHHREQRRRDHPHDHEHRRHPHHADPDRQLAGRRDGVRDDGTDRDRERPLQRDHLHDPPEWRRVHRQRNDPSAHVDPRPGRSRSRVKLHPGHDRGGTTRFRDGLRRASGTTIRTRRSRPTCASTTAGGSTTCPTSTSRTRTSRRWSYYRLVPEPVQLHRRQYPRQRSPVPGLDRGRHSATTTPSSSPSRCTCRT